MSRKEAPREGLVRAALKGRVTNREAADALGLSLRQFRRVRARYRVAGVEGIVHANRGRPSRQRLPEEIAERITRLLAEKYAGFNDRHLTEKLRTVEDIEVSRERVKLRERNEALDLEVYALAALHILGPTFVRGLGERAAQLARPVAEAAASVEPAPQPFRRSGGWIPRRTGWVNGWRN